MIGGDLFKRAKKIIFRGGSSAGESSQTLTTPETLVYSDSFTKVAEHSGTQPPLHSTYEQCAQQNDGIWPINANGSPIQRMERTICPDIQSMTLSTRVHIELNEHNVPCNIPEATLLGSYLGVIARDPVLAPISFSDWQNKEMEPFKRRMLAKVESKFEMPRNVRPWILQSIGVKWRNHKTNLKAEHWNNRSVEEIMEAIPEGVDPAQWCQLVTQWDSPEDEDRSAKNTENVRKQICPYTMGRMSSIRKPKEMAIHDKLQLWRINKIYKDDSWSLDDAKLRSTCDLLVKEGLTPEGENIETNERIFKMVMSPEHPGRVRTQELGVTPNCYFSNSPPTEDSSSSEFARITKLEEEFYSFRSEMMEFMQCFNKNNQPRRNLQIGGNSNTNEE